MIVPWVTQTYQHRSPDVSSQRTLNLYPESTEGNGKTDWVLIGTPGEVVEYDLSSFGTVCRGIYAASNGQLYCVYDTKVIKVRSGTGISPVNIGTISSGAGTVSMTDDGTNVVICDGVGLLLVNMVDNSTQTVVTPFTPRQLAFVGQRIVGVSGTDDNFYWSGIRDAETWDALAVAQAETSPDDLVGIAEVGGDLWLFGSRSYEVRRTGIDPDNPYDLVGGSAGEVGCGAWGSIAQIGDVAFFLGSSSAGNGQVFRTNGYGVERISNHAIERVLSSGDASDAIGWTYQQEGHTFYVLTLVGINRTFAFDIGTGQWHERATRNPSTGALSRWDPQYGALAFGKVYTGSRTNGRLLSLSLDKFTDWQGNEIPRIHQGPIYWNEMRELYHNEFQVDLETGVGLQTGQGSDPKIMLQFSDDGGHTWSSELWTSMGKVGYYKARACWRRLGRSRERVYRVTITDPVKVVIIGGRVEAVVGTR